MAEQGRADTVVEVRIHGRGGQGVVTAAELMALAAWEEGLWAQAFPTFGSERMGAPVAGFVRISGGGRLAANYQVYQPDYVIVQDPTLVGAVDLLDGLEPSGVVLVNWEEKPGELYLGRPPAGFRGRVYAVPATAIALETVGQPRPNTPLLGAFAAITGLVTLDAVMAALARRFPAALAEKNAEAARRGFQAAQRYRGGAPGLTLAGEPTQGRQAAAGTEEVTEPCAGGPFFPAALIAAPGSSRANLTGSWRTFRPVVDQDKCTACGICVPLCPEGIIVVTKSDKYRADYDYCKGCGICAEVCPFHALSMEREVRV